MPNARLAGRYAKSILDLAIEQGQLEAVYTDMKYLQAVCNASSEFVNMLRSPIIKADQKNSILSAVLKNNVGVLTNSFIVLLVKKGRESDLHEIANTFIEQYNGMKGIHQVTLTTAVEISTDMKNAIADKSLILPLEISVARQMIKAWYGENADKDLVGNESWR